MGEPLFGLLETDRLLQRAADLAQLAVLAGRNPKEHLLKEPQRGFGKPGIKYPRKLLNLRAQFLRDFGNLHYVASVAGILLNSSLNSSGCGGHFPTCSSLQQAPNSPLIKISTQKPGILMEGLVRFALCYIDRETDSF